MPDQHRRVPSWTARIEYVRAKGLEPLWLTPHGPKPCACTNSATPAGPMNISDVRSARGPLDHLARPGARAPEWQADRGARVGRDHPRPAQGGGAGRGPAAVGRL